MNRISPVQDETLRWASSIWVHPTHSSGCSVWQAKGVVGSIMPNTVFSVAAVDHSFNTYRSPVLPRFLL